MDVGVGGSADQALSARGVASIRIALHAAMPLEQLDQSSRSALDPDELPPLALVYKHSPMCAISARAIVEVETFAKENPDVPVFVVDVLMQRSLSQELAARYGIEHESPQIILLKHGKPAWHKSGMRIRYDVLEYAVDSAA